MIFAVFLLLTIFVDWIEYSQCLESTRRIVGWVMVRFVFGRERFLKVFYPCITFTHSFGFRIIDETRDNIGKVKLNFAIDICEELL